MELDGAGMQSLEVVGGLVGEHLPKHAHVWLQAKDMQAWIAGNKLSPFAGGVRAAGFTWRRLITFSTRVFCTIVAWTVLSAAAERTIKAGASGSAPERGCCLRRLPLSLRCSLLSANGLLGAPHAFYPLLEPEEADQGAPGDSRGAARVSCQPVGGRAVRRGRSARGA